MNFLSMLKQKSVINDSWTTSIRANDIILSLVFDCFSVELICDQDRALINLQVIRRYLLLQLVVYLLQMLRKIKQIDHFYSLSIFLANKIYCQHKNLTEFLNQKT